MFVATNGQAIASARTAKGIKQLQIMNTEGRPAAGQPLPSVASPPAADTLSDPEQCVELNGDYLFKSALMRLRDTAKAEDRVQETLLATLKSGKTFAGRSAEKSWLIGILKNKVCDQYRRASRETSVTDMEFYSDEESDRFIPDGLFKDGWIHQLGPHEWLKQQ